MYNFTFHRPTTVRQAAGLLARNPDGKLLAGGHSLLPVMKQRLAQPSALIDLALVEGLTGIEQKGRSIVIGAMTRHADVANSPVLQQALPGLAIGAGLDRRPAGAQPRHHRRLDRQQRSERRLSGGLSRPRRHHHHQQAADRGRRFLHRHVHDRAGRRRDHHQDQLPDRQEGGLREVQAPGLGLCAGRRVRVASAAPTSAWR